MDMIDAGQLKRGIVLLIEGMLYHVIDFQHIKMGRGSAQIRLKLRDIKAGHTTEKSFQASEKFSRADLERHMTQYLYGDGNLYYFMDNTSFEQITLDKKLMGDALGFLKEGGTIEVFTYEGNAISIEIPLNVDLYVAETGPSFRGNTTSAGSKPATLETGITVQVPFFINTGDLIKVDTRTSQYLERVEK